MKGLLVLLMFVFPVNAAISSIIGSNLIDQTCKQTPYYKLCVSCLISDPHSFSTDVKGLAKIMVYIIDAKATQTLKRINHLLERRSSSLSDRERESLKACAERYNVIIRGDIPQSIDALSSSDYKFAQEGTSDAAMEAISCEEEFHGQSPVSNMNVEVHDISVVAASIVKLILSS